MASPALASTNLQGSASDGATSPNGRGAAEANTMNPNPPSIGKLLIRNWKYGMDSLRKAVSLGVLVLTHHAATHPVSHVVGICLFSFAMMGIGFATNFDMSVAANDYLTPTHSVIWEQREWIEEKSNFPPRPHSLRILIHKHGENVVSLEGASKTFDVLDQIQSTAGYTELCKESEETNTAGFSGLCHIRGLPMLWNHSRDVFQDSVTSNVDLLLQISADKYPDGSDIDPRELMGHMQVLNGTLTGIDIIQTAKSFLMEVIIPAAPTNSKQIAIDVLNQLQTLRSEWSSTDSPYRLEIYLLDHSLESETVRAVFYDLPLIPSVFVIMALFTCLVFSTTKKPDGKRFESRFMLGFGAVATVLLSLATSYGLLWIIGVPFTSLTQILPFIMFGIGLDDAFIIQGEYVRTDESKDPVERIKDTFEEVGLSIFLTTLTTTLAFGLGCLASVPTVIWLSMYAFPTVMIDFVYQITFFVAVVVLDERRIAKKKKAEEERKRSQKELGEENKPEVEGTELTPREAAKTEDFSDPYNFSEDVASQSNDNQHFSHNAPTSGMDRFMKRYADVLLTKPAKIVVLVCFVLVSALGAISTSKFTQEFNIYEVLMKDSYVSGYYSSVDKYAETGFILPEVYFRNVDQSDPEIQEQMVNFVEDLVSDVDAITEEPTFFWLWQFQDFLTYDDRLLELTFNQQMDIFLSIDVFKILYGDHIVRDEETGDILASRVVIHMDNIDVEDVQNQIDAWAEQLSVTEVQPINAEELIVEGSGFNFFLYEGNMIYGFEFYAIFVDELINSSIFGVVAVTIVTFLFLPHWSAPLFLCPLLSVLYIDLIGFLQVCGVHLNAISYFTLLMSIGLLIDFNMHILVRFLESPCTTREEKVKDSLQTMGSSVVIGGLSTFLGVVPLLFSTSSFMKNLFYGFWGMVIIGCGHGIIVLPVILSYLGPEGTYGVKASAAAQDSEASTGSIEDAKELKIQDATVSICPTVPTSDTGSRAHLESDGDSSGVSFQKHSLHPATHRADAPATDGTEASPLILAPQPSGHDN